MTAYAWSTITTAQAIGFTTADTLAFDAGGSARQVAVSIGPAAGAMNT